MKIGDYAAIVCCSNGQSAAQRTRLERLHQTLLEIGLQPVWSDCIYEKESVFSGTAQERAENLMQFYKNERVKVIFDISGGDIANEILPYLDFAMIAESGKTFWGYSDLTTVLNAIYTKTGKESVLYQVRNLIGREAVTQIPNFCNTVLAEQSDLFDWKYSFVQKSRMTGVVVGGNIRCLLKLAGTEYWPDMTGKILLLEAMGGGIPQMTAYLNQLMQMGVFQKIAGILLGTFTNMEKEKCVPGIVELVKRYAGTEIPIAYTPEIGHGADAKGIVIGRELELRVSQKEECPVMKTQCGKKNGKGTS